MKRTYRKTKLRERIEEINQLATQKEKDRMIGLLDGILYELKEKAGKKPSSGDGS